jgi:putative flippase GtrA
MIKKLIFNLFIKKNDATHIQFFRYIFTGGFAAVINIGIFVFCTDILGIYYLAGNTFGFCAGLLTNYVLCKYFVFTGNMSIRKTEEFILYCIISIISLGIDTSVLYACTHFAGIHHFASKIIATGTGFLWNFSGRKYTYMKLKRSDKNNG